MECNRMKLPLFDDFWIDFRVGTVRRWYAPEPFSLCPAGPYSSLIYDRERGVYRVYYETLMELGKDGPRYLKAQESTDLIHFSPLLTLDGSDVLYDGESGVHGCSVLYDEYEKDPKRRYKLCGMTRMGRKGLPKEVELAFSADGITWENDHRYLIHPFTSDTRNSIFYNPYDDEYTLLHRSAHVDRRISVKSSKDLIRWTEPRIILHPGASYNDGFTAMHHYAMGVRFMDGIFYGLVWRYNTCLYGEDYTRMFGYMEPELFYSYDGKEFLSTTGKPLMERPYPPEPGCAGLAPQDLCESRDGKEYYIICSGAVFVHGTQDSNKERADALRGKTVKKGSPIYKIRRDGFCGIESVGMGGKVVTKPIQLIKDDLCFNIRANYGFVRFGLMNRAGEFLEGFSFDDCIPFSYGDDTDVVPMWKEHKLFEVLGQQVRVAVELNTAILHCISGTARPHIRQAQKSFAQPWGIEY
ncbi:MAG: hypothetical protein IJC26_02460 [Clostridia bacterium]|nr:hypothetical protein [Clostridia bacterium]